MLRERLKAAMSAAGIRSEGELARLSGVPQPTIHRIITGQSVDPRRSNLEKIANACGISYLELASGGNAVAEQKPHYRARPEGSELEFVGHLDAWDSDTPLDEDEVELPLFREVELSAGAGQTQVIENQGAKLRFAKATLSRANVAPECAACAFVRGNSMEPVMPDGTTVGVNTAETDIRDGEIYALDHDGMLRVKYLYRKPGGGMMIRSQNQDEHPDEHYTNQDIADQHIRVIGRVFWWSVLR